MSFHIMAPMMSIGGLPLAARRWRKSLFRFQTRIRLGKSSRLNLSNRGASISLGGRGLTHTIGSTGQRTTFSAPGTGFSYSAQRGSRSRYRRRRSSSNASGIAFLFLLGLWAYSSWPRTTLFVGVPPGVLIVLGWLFGGRR